MPDRYFADSPITDEKVCLSGSEAHHLIHVMRARRGTEAILFDGSGFEFLANVERVGRSDVEFVVLSRRENDKELPFVLTLCVALPKSDRQKWLIEKAVELGVGRLIPLKTERGVSQPVQHALERLRRTVIEASKQCGRNRLMQIGEPMEWPELIENTRIQPFRLIAHPGGTNFSADMSSHLVHLTDNEMPPQELFVSVGPEGGFTDEEVELATKAGWQTVNLGPRILRIETAALLLAGMVAQRCLEPKQT
jgi:16S rRNA (uracil1498-N3)-methyltransferase